MGKEVIAIPEEEIPDMIKALDKAIEKLYWHETYFDGDLNMLKKLRKALNAD